MAVRPESSFPRPDPLRLVVAAAVGVAIFSAAWTLLRAGVFSDAPAIVDTPVYRGYGDAVLDGQVPYRDFALEYPPGALPVFVLPSLGAPADYDPLFQLLMLACGASAIVCVALALTAAGASTPALFGGVALAAATPLLLGSVILTRYDLWPAVLTAGALAALVGGRDRLGLGLLGAAVAAKVYPFVVVPIALVDVWRRKGGREAGAALGVFVAVLGVTVVPFLVVAPDGLADALARQTGRPLQIESLGAGVLLAGHRLGLYEAAVESSHGSQNLVGALSDALATVQTILQAFAILAVWVVFARGRAAADRVLAASAAAVAAFVALGKVLSPQFLIWLAPLVPLVVGRAALAPAALLVAALVLTQAWFPSRYWDVVALEPVAWLVVVRDGVLVALFAALLAVTGREREPRDTR